jgi:hypothetical protein
MRDQAIKLAPGLWLPTSVSTQTLLVVGKRGSGKTSTGVRFVEQLHAAKVPCVIIDPADVWWGLKASGTGPGLEVYVFGGRYADVPLEAHGGALLADVVVEQRISAVLSVRHLSGGDRTKFVTDFAQRLIQRNTKRLHVVLEEAHELAPQNPMPGEQVMLGAIKKLWKLGRSSGLGGTAITQRPAALSKDITTQSEILAVHRLIGPQDVAAIREWIRYHGEAETILPELSKLHTGEAFIWAPDFPEDKPIGLQRVNVYARTTCDSSATPDGSEHVEPKSLVPVDLDRIREKMAETIERAQAADPKHLRKRIAELERDLAAEKKAKAPKEPKPAPAADFRAIRKARDRARACLDRANDAIQNAVGELAVLEQAIDLTSAGPQRDVWAPAVIQRAPDRSVVATVSIVEPKVSRGATSAARADGAGSFRMMIALAQRPGLTRRQLGLRARVAVKGGSFRTYMSALRGKGFIQERTDGTIHLTAEGRDEMAARHYDPLPEGPALLEHYLAELGASSGATRMLRALSEVYPRALSREELAQRSTVDLAGGSFRTYLSKLRGLELVEKRGADLVMSEELA